MRTHYQYSFPAFLPSEYERETWEDAENARSGVLEKDIDSQSYASYDTRSRRGSAAQRGGSRQAGTTAGSAYDGGGDYYRDSSAMARPGPGSQRDLRPMTSYSTMHSAAMPQQDPRVASMAGLSQWGAGSVYGMPAPMFAQNPFMGGSPLGSEYGGGAPPGSMMGGPGNMMMGPPMSSYGMMGGGGGMMASSPQHAAPRNSMMTNLNDFNGAPPMMNPQATGGSGMGSNLMPGMPNRPYSTYSFANTANPFDTGAAEPAPLNYMSDPTDDDILKTLKADLACQDLTTVTKRKIRDLVMSKYPNADLTGKTKFINENIDRLLSEV